jgi:Predicted permeases
MTKPKFLQPPWLELIIMLAAVALSVIGFLIISFLSQPNVSAQMNYGMIALWLIAFFLISFAIALISVLAGIGGGILFTPIMMAFTPVNSLVIRATGLIVAMFGGLISTGVFMKKGLGNLKICIILSISQGIGALLGARYAIVAADMFGDLGEGMMRIFLGGILALVAVNFLAADKRFNWPNIRNVDKITGWMGLKSTYYEESEKKSYSYRVTRILLGLALVLFVGFIGGFFGIGAGWAITPIQNIALGVPLKVAAANSGIILGMVNCVAVWPYMLAGGIIPLFVLPWLSGKVTGGYLGALVFVKAKVTVIRFILSGIMIYTSFQLITDGLVKFHFIPKIPSRISLAIFLIIMVFDAILLFRAQRKEEKKEAGEIIMNGMLPYMDKSQLHYGKTAHWITGVSCLISLVTPFFILLFPNKNHLNEVLLFDAILKGKNPAEIWKAAGIQFKSGDFWPLFIKNFFTPDGLAAFGVALGCSVTLWALIPAVCQFTKKKEYFYVGVSIFLMALIVLAMSGIVNMAG